MTPGPTPKVLIVDDEAPARSELRFLLEQAGAVEVVGEAGSAAEALQLIAAIEYDIVFLDIEMPGLSGLDLAKALADAKRSPAVIFVTAYSEHALAAFEVAAADYLVKPVGLERLRQAPDDFKALAAECSNCPSSGIGGSLGQISRGETVPEFERVIFGEHTAGLVGRVIETRFGLHIIRIDRRIEGRVLPFDQVKGQITQALGAALADRAARDFVTELVSRAAIEGIVIEPGSQVLVQ